MFAHTQSYFNPNVLLEHQAHQPLHEVGKAAAFLSEPRQTSLCPSVILCEIGVALFGFHHGGHRKHRENQNQLMKNSERRNARSDVEIVSLQELRLRAGQTNSRSRHCRQAPNRCQTGRNSSRSGHRLVAGQKIHL